jgi:hypothetical protein
MKILDSHSSVPLVEWRSMDVTLLADGNVLNVKL